MDWPSMCWEFAESRREEGQGDIVREKAPDRTWRGGEDQKKGVPIGGA